MNDTEPRRFVIYVPVPPGDTGDLYGLRLNLHYDAFGVNVRDRGQDPAALEQAVGELASVCRPPHPFVTLSSGADNLL